MRRRKKSRASKISKIRQAKKEASGIYMSENYWLVPKPYNTFGKTDPFYFEIANKVYEVLREHKDFVLYGGMMDTYLYILSCNLTSYFEDRMSDLGLWQAFIDTNMELYEYWLPFYNLENYNAQGINVQDIYYLLWHRLTKERAEIVSPQTKEIKTIGKAVFSIFEQAKSKAKKNPEYKKSLSLKNVESSEVENARYMLQWLAVRSYLNGSDLAISYQEERQQMIREKEGNMRPEEASYIILEDYAYLKRSSFSAMSSVDLLAKAAKVSADKKEAIKNLERHAGLYEYQSSDIKYHIFQHVQTLKTYSVIKSSFQPSPFRKGQVFATTFIPWDGYWALSGLLIGVSETGFPKPGLLEAEREKPLENKSLWSAAQKEKIRASIKKEHQVFLDTFGSSLLFYTDKKTYRNDMIRFYSNLRKVINDSTTLDIEEEEQIEDMIRNLTSQLEIEESAVFHDLQTGIAIFYKIPVIIELLEKAEPTAEDIQKLFTFFVRKENPYSFLKYLLEQYPTDNLQFPDDKDAFDVPKHLHFLRRFYHPDDFGRYSDLPEMSLVNHREM